MPIASRTTTVSDTTRMTRPTRALHVVPALFGEGGIFGGAERYALELARHMAEITPTRLVTFADAPARSDIGRLDVRVLGPAWRDRGQRNLTPRGLTRVFGYLDRSISMGFRWDLVVVGVKK